MANLIQVIRHLVENSISDLQDLSKGKNRINDMGDSLQESLEGVKITQEIPPNVRVTGGLITLPQGLTISQLLERFGCGAALVRKQKSKYRDEPEKFVAWSKSRDSDKYGWKFNEVDRVFDRVE